MKRSRSAFDRKTEDLVWDGLGELRDSPAVAEAYAFARDRAAPRKPWRRLRDALAAVLAPRAMASMACVAAAAVVIVLLLPAEPQTIETAVGQRKTVVLADGSTLLLDTDTRLKVVLDGRERRLVLMKGQANFKVAHDAGRPFRVTAGGMTVTAIGTDFDVAVLSDRRAVTLIDGKVAVEIAEHSGVTAGRKVVLSPGQRLAVEPGGRLGEPIAVDMDGVLAWQQGRIEFENVTVAEAIAEANRYSEAKIRLLHEASADKHIDGVFRTDRIDAVVAALCAYLDLEVVYHSEEEIVLDRIG